MWANWPDERLLDLRFCDLGLSIHKTVLEERIEQLYEEMARRGLRFRPHFWLSYEWFCPDGVPGVAIPFYLAHPRLMKLEHRQMLEVEGGTRDWCMRLLRHEVGHAINNAYRLHRRRRWREVFGKATEPYPDYYQPRPFSRRFVIHLDYWYAQSHPSEDFAETFAVWLSSRSLWKKRYQGWPALKKLEYVNELMGEIADAVPPVRTRRQEEPLRTLKTTLREHYTARRSHYGIEHPDFYDRDLRRLFTDTGRSASSEKASVFLRRIGPEIRELVAHWTGEHQYTIEQVLDDMITRCRELKLRVNRPKTRAKMEAAILLTVQTMNYLHSGYHRLAI